MVNFTNALKENKEKKPQYADIDVGTLSSATEGKLFEGDLVKKEPMARPREPQRGMTDAAFRSLRDKLKKDPKHEGYRKQMKEFLKFNPSFKTAK